MWVLKQIKNGTEREYLHLVADVLVAQMALDLGIPCNGVRLISRTEMNEYKVFPDEPATLHSWVEGVLLEELPHWSDLEVGQRVRPVGTPQYRKYGPLPSHREGLNQAVVDQMTRHPDLPPLVALDTSSGRT